MYNQNLLKLLKRKVHHYPALEPILIDLKESEFITWGQIWMIEKVLKGDINDYLVFTEDKARRFRYGINDAHYKIYSTLRQLSGRVHYKWEKERCKFWLDGKLFFYDENLINGKIFIYVRELDEILFKEAKRVEV